MTHNNNPIQLPGIDARIFDGFMDIAFGAFTLPFPYVLTETPNVGGGNCCNDLTGFTVDVSPVDITIDGLPYNLVLLGFVADADGNCPATPAGAVGNNFITIEGTDNFGCLYAELSQVRPLTIRKVVTSTGSPPIPAFPFVTTSTLPGASPWDPDFSLTPSGFGVANADSEGPFDFLPSEETSDVHRDGPGRLGPHWCDVRSGRPARNRSHGLELQRRHWHADPGHRA